MFFQNYTEFRKSQDNKMFHEEAKKVTQSSGIEDMHTDLLVKILSFLPKDIAVSTRQLSKEWKLVWRWLTTLDFDDTGLSQSQCESLRLFINNNLPHHESAFKSFSLQLSNQEFFPYDEIINWVELVVARSVQELSIACASNSPDREHTILDGSLYACRSLVSLKLQGLLFVEVPSYSAVCLPSLKTLILRKLGIHSVESLQLILSSCPILEELTAVDYVFEVDKNETGRDFSIRIPSLQRLSIDLGNIGASYKVVIISPALKYFEVSDFVARSCLIENMPEVEEAHIWVITRNHEMYLRAMTSVKRLWLCVIATRAEDVVIFNQLEHLTICTCQPSWGYIFAWLLKGLRKPRVLKLEPFDEHVLDSNGSAGWEVPNTVPKCFGTSLETFKWRKHECNLIEDEDDFNLGRYVLENACCLKTATIVASSDEQLGMITSELSLFTLASPTCQLELSVEEIESSDDDDDDESDVED